MVLDLSRLLLGQLNGRTAVEFCRAFSLSIPHHKTTISYPHKKTGWRRLIGHLNPQKAIFGRAFS
jgi:hypothetical protein